MVTWCVGKKRRGELLPFAALNYTHRRKGVFNGLSIKENGSSGNQTREKGVSEFVGGPSFDARLRVHVGNTGRPRRDAPTNCETTGENYCFYWDFRLFGVHCEPGVFKFESVQTRYSSRSRVTAFSKQGGRDRRILPD